MPVMKTLVITVLHDDTVKVAGKSRDDGNGNNGSAGGSGSSGGGGGGGSIGGGLDILHRNESYSLAVNSEAVASAEAQSVWGAVHAISTFVQVVNGPLRAIARMPVVIQVCSVCPRM